MVTKKTVTKKSIKKIEPEIKPEVKKSIPYKPEFKTIKLIVSEKIDLNWISIRRKIQAYNIWKIKIKINPVKINLWGLYCNWFNDIFNKEKVKEDIIFRSDK
jgi:hypothetical protein